MVYLAKNFGKDKSIPLKEVSKHEAIPFDFLEKIILQLEKAKLVKGKKGIGGGYILAKSPRKISIKEIVEKLEKTIIPVDCSFCGRKNKCLAKNVWSKVDLALNKTLNSITLAQLIK